MTSCIVFHHEDGPRVGRHISRGIFRRRRGDRRLAARQIDRDLGAVADLARDLHRAAGAMRQAVDLGQAETGALVRSLGGEERFDHARQEIGRNAAAGIGDGERDIVAGGAVRRVVGGQRNILRRNRYASAIGHGIAGIDREIDQRQFELGFVDADRPRRGGNIDQEFDIDMHGAGQHVANGGNRSGEADHGRVQRQRARERQQLPRQILAAGRRHFDGLQGADVARLAQALLQALCVPADDHQEIVEVVGDAAGELPDRFHFLQMGGLPLGVLQGGGGFFFRGDVPAGDVDQPVMLGHGPLQPAPGAVLVAEPVLHPHGRHALHQLLAPRLGMGGVVGMAQCADMHRLDLVLAPAEEPAPGRIHAQEIAFEIRNAEQILGHVPDAVALQRALFDFVLELFAELAQLAFDAVALMFGLVCAR